MTAQISYEPRVRLTEGMRDWLRDPAHATMPGWDMVGLFMREFQLAPEDTGRLLGQWVIELYGSPLEQHQQVID